MRIIDAHIHLWDTSRQHLPWLDGPDADPRLLGRFTADDLSARYAAALPADCAFDGGVYVEVDCADPLDEDRQLATNRDPRVLAKVMRSTLDPAMRVPLFAAGVRDPLHVPGSERGRCLDDGFVAGLRLLGQAGLPFDACVRRDELDDLAETAERAPDTTIVVDHMGNVTPGTLDERYVAAMRRLAACPNVVVKVSGYPTDDRRFVRDLLALSRELFDGRRMAASNWPVVDSYSSLEAHLSTLLDEDGDDERLYHDTAAHVYGIGRRPSSHTTQHNASIQQEQHQ
ncbi:amidohydrolase family protein [Bifidobacterium sp. 82T10]|uniref:Amidohydrolase family protein n=1 Tax=Bifidobacterium miconis TaxID=2834435 RepID=A0ABS6WDI3_9BIFI|nr:amidohydrolase family protein [Bifidobacterium miconis]MBW3091917.1 amidohydrolase family protein [Bifidobacterium miconis]